MRDRRIDVIKGIATVLVVIGHNIQLMKGTDYAQGEFFSNPLYSFIYSFHMPLFMLISGYLYYGSTNKYSLKDLILKKLKTLIIPVFVWSFFINLVLITFNQIDASLIGLVFGPFKSLWFFWAVFYSSLGLIVGKKFFKDSILFHVVIVISLLLVPDILNKELYAFMYPYFVIGYYAKKNDFKLENINIITSLASFVLLSLFWGNDKYIYTTGITLIRESGFLEILYIDVYRWLVGLVGSMSLIKMIDIIIKRTNYEFSVLISVGKKSMGIYILDVYVSLYLFQKINHFNNLDEITYTVICLLLSPFIVWILILTKSMIEKNKTINSILFGEYSAQKDLILSQKIKH